MDTMSNKIKRPDYVTPFSPFPVLAAASAYLYLLAGIPKAASHRLQKERYIAVSPIGDIPEYRRSLTFPFVAVR